MALEYNTTPLKKAILILPGIMGSNLVDENNTQDLLWFDTGMGNAKGIAKILLSQISANKDGTSKNKSIIPLNGENEYGAMDNYKNLILELRKYGEKIGAKVEFIPYDWRMDLEDGASRLENIIAQYDEVSIVAHSMGGLVVEEYINTRGTDKIKKVITIGTPYWGSPMAFKALYSGEIDALKQASFILADIVRSIIINFPGIYELLPNKHYTSKKAWLYQIEKVYSNPWRKLYKIPEYKRMPQYWNGTKEIYFKYFNELLVEKAIRENKQIYPTEFTSPMDLVDSTMIVGVGKPTEDEMLLIDEMIYGESVRAVSSEKSNLGDGTVPFISATMNRIKDRDLTFDHVQRIYNFVILNDINHTELVKKDRAIEEILIELGLKSSLPNLILY